MSSVRLEKNCEDTIFDNQVGIDRIKIRETVWNETLIAYIFAELPTRRKVVKLRSFLYLIRLGLRKSHYKRQYRWKLQSEHKIRSITEYILYNIKIAWSSPQNLARQETVSMEASKWALEINAKLEVNSYSHPTSIRWNLFSKQN